MTDREKLLEWVKRVCHNPNLEDEGDLSLVLDKLATWFKHDLGIASKTVSRYSVAYKSTVPDDISVLLAPYRRVVMV